MEKILEKIRNLVEKIKRFIDSNRGTTAMPEFRYEKGLSNLFLNIEKFFLYLKDINIFFNKNFYWITYYKIIFKFFI